MDCYGPRGFLEICSFRLSEGLLAASPKIRRATRVQAAPLLVNVGIAGAVAAVGRRPAQSGLINDGYDRPIAPVAGGVVAGQFRRVEPRGFASIEKSALLQPRPSRKKRANS